ncbi:hypothetical protein H4219_005548, partial [Mycoemilia scoparia]
MGSSPVLSDALRATGEPNACTLAEYINTTTDILSPYISDYSKGSYTSYFTLANSTAALPFKYWHSTKSVRKALSGLMVPLKTPQ